MSSKKIVFLGGGSPYFPNRMTRLLLSDEFAESEVVLYDIDGRKAEMVAGVFERLNGEAKRGFRIRSTVELADAVDGADFAISSIGGSGAEMTPRVNYSYYHAADIRIPERYGVYQIVGDTCGPAGMMMGLRSVPVYLEICREMERRCPGVIFLSHSNPMAVLCRAMRKYSSIAVYGVCHGVQAGVKRLAGLLGVAPAELECVWIGTNHYYWVMRVSHKGRDVTAQALELASRETNEHFGLCTELSAAYGHIILYPHDNHAIEFYPYAARLRAKADLPFALAGEAAERHSAAEKSLALKGAATPASVREEFFQNYRAMIEKARLPTGPDDRITGEGVVSLMEAIAQGRREVFILNLPNDGVVSNLPATAIVEAEAVTDSRGARAIRAGECPLVLKGILEKRFAWHELVVEAAVTGDRRLALQALLLDEMAVLPAQASAMLDELLKASRELLPQFFPR